MYKNYKNIKFLSCEKDETKRGMFNTHRKLYNLCKRHGAVLDLATSDVVIYIQHGNEKLLNKLKSIYPDEFYNGKLCGGAKWDDEATKEIVIW